MLFHGRVAIVGGGPSLKGFPFHELPGHHTIAINRALEDLPEARMLWWSDERFYRRNEKAIREHKAELKATGLTKADSKRMAYPKPIKVYKFTGMLGWDVRPDCLKHGNNGGYASIHVAPKLGAKAIVLFGLDMAHGPAGEVHYHSGHGFATRPEENIIRHQLPHFVHLVEPLRILGIPVYNASPASRIECWPKVTPEEGLRIMRDGHS